MQLWWCSGAAWLFHLILLWFWAAVMVIWLSLKCLVCCLCFSCCPGHHWDILEKEYSKQVAPLCCPLPRYPGLFLDSLRLALPSAPLCPMTYSQRQAETDKIEGPGYRLCCPADCGGGLPETGGTSYGTGFCPMALSFSSR